MSFQLRSELSATAERSADVRWKCVPDDRSCDGETSLADGRVCPQNEQVAATSRTEYSVLYERPNSPLSRFNMVSKAMPLHCKDLLCIAVGRGGAAILKVGIQIKHDSRVQRAKKKCTSTFPKMVVRTTSYHRFGQDLSYK